MKRSTLLLLVGIVFVLAAGGVFWYARLQGYQTPTVPTTPPPVSGPKVTEPTPAVATYDVLTYTSSTAATEITRTTLADKKRQIVFTDRDESLKVKALRRATSDGQTILAYFAHAGDQLATVLGTITYQGQGAERTLLANFGAAEAPIPSPNGEQVAYIVFSNADPDYGYSLMLMNNDGSGKRRLARRATLLTQPAFSPDGKKIAFLVDTDNGMAIQTVATSGSSGPTTITQFAGAILYDLSWGNALFFGKRPSTDTAANQGEVYQVAADGSGLTRLTDNTAFDGSPVPSTDGKLLALTRTTFQGGKYTSAGTMTLVVQNLTDKTETELGPADGVLGWVAAETSAP